MSNEKLANRKNTGVNRRAFLAASAAAPAAFHIVPRHVLGGPGNTPPSETFGAALIGVGGRGPGTYRDLSNKHGLAIRDIAQCDVKWVGKADNKTRYTDFRRLLERSDLDIVAIATPPHWHALISIAAMEAGKDVLCEKPMTRFVGEGRAVADVAKRTGRIYQIGTYGRFGRQSPNDLQTRKIMRAGLAKGKGVRHVNRGGLKVKQWSGPLNVTPREVPASLDWDLYCGPSPLKPFHPSRFGGMHRGYWDYDGGGLGDMGQHKFDPLAWVHGWDETLPVEVEAHAPPAHPETTGMWGWVRLKYPDGSELVLESGEWGEPTGLASRGISRNDLSEVERTQLDALPDPEPLIGFGEAVKTRQQAGGHAEAAHRTVCIMHLANIAIRTGRTVHFDPDTEQVIGDEEANRLAHQPMRAPWHL
jgi:hypothetical protein